MATTRLTRLQCLEYFRDRHCADCIKAISSDSEEDCQRFLASHPSIILGALGNHGIAHRSFCLPQFPFGSDYVSDFVLASVTSMGWYITLVEIEPATAKFTTRKGAYAQHLNEALSQINDWAAWFDQHWDYFISAVERKIECSISDDIERAYWLGWKSLASGCQPIVDFKIVIGRSKQFNQRDDEKRRALFRASARKIEVTNFDRLLWCYVRSTMKRLAACMNTPEEELVILAQSGIDVVEESVASNPSASRAALSLLAASRNTSVVERVAMHRNTPTDILTSLARRRTLLRAVLSNPSCPAVVAIDALASDDVNVRIVAVRHPKLRDPSLLRRLARNEDVNIRKNVARNPNTTAEIVRILERDPIVAVRNCLRDNAI